MKKIFLFSLGFVWMGISVFGSTNPTKDSKANSKIHPMFRKEEPILSDRISVKRKKGGFGKSNALTWETTLHKAKAISVKPMFPQHASDETELSRIFEVALLPGTDVYDAISVFYQDPRVEWAEPIYLRKIHYTPNDPGFATQWYLSKIQLSQAWDIWRNANEVLIGIVDTGVWTNHPDLVSAIWTNSDEIPNNGIDDDGNGYVDDVHGWDFGDQDNDPSPSMWTTASKKWHGTMVAGVAGARADNGEGIASPAYNAKIMPIKCSEDQDTEQYILYGYQGILYAVDNGAHIINCSFGGGSSSLTEQEVISYALSKGCLIVASAGNENSDAPVYPGAFPGVLCVGSTGPGDQKSSFSNYGSFVDLTAPGETIYTTTEPNSYTWVDGTSFSSPLVASVCALVKGLHPEWNGIQVGEQIRVSADPIDVYNIEYIRTLGFGRLNAEKALTLSRPSIRFESFQFDESPTASNKNGNFDPGETVLLTFQVKNWLASASNIRIEFSVTQQDIVIENGTFTLASLGTLQTWSNSTNPVKIHIGQSVERGQRIPILAEMTASGGYSDFEWLTFDISTSYANISTGNCQLSIASNGRLGSSDIILEQGDGFIFKDKGNLLFEGAIMAGISPSAISDVARGVSGERQNEDFHPVPGGEIVIAKPGKFSNEEGVTTFTDEKANPSLGLKVTLTGLAFQTPPYQDFILLAYRLSNVKETPIENLYFGLFMDWDIEGLQDAYHNLGGFDPELNLAYIYEPLSGVYGATQVVSKGGATAYKLINNEVEIYPDAGGYSDQEKWTHLSGGIQNVAPLEQKDYSHVLGVGPLRISPGDTVQIGFAILGGNTLNELRQSAQWAKTKWKELFESSDVEMATSSFPFRFELYPNYPNPFNPETEISYEIPKPGHVLLAIYDVQGKEISRLIDTFQAPGKYTVKWNGSGKNGPVPSGIYVYQLKACGKTQTRKMILTR